jgi:excisionase family DNA binding protein
VKLWTVQRIAKALKASDDTIRRAIRGSGIEVLPVNRTLKVKDSVLLDWLGFDPWRDPVWTVAEVARHAAVSIPTVERTIRAGKLGSVVVGERLRRIRHSQLVAWLGVDPTRDPVFKPRPPAKPADPSQGKLFDM